MLTEARYPASWLASRTQPIDAPLVARSIGWVRVRAFDLLKAVVRTPMSGGKVDYDQVPVGASIWVTVTDEASPMHGRPILITKRPDGQFALEGGSGVTHWHDDPARAKRIAARRHLVLGVGKVRGTEVDQKVAGKVRERDAKRQQLLEQQQQGREARREAAKVTRSALGLPADHTLSKPEKAKYQAQMADLFKQAGADDKAAARYAAVAASEMGQVKQRFVSAHALKRIERARQMIGGPLLSFAEPGVDPQAEAAASPAESPNLATGEAATMNFDMSAMVASMMQAAEAAGKPLTQPEAEMAAQLEADRQLQAATAAPATPEEALSSPVTGGTDVPAAPPANPEAPAPELAPHTDPLGSPDPAGLDALAQFGAAAQAAQADDPLGLGTPPEAPAPVTVPLVELPQWTTEQKAEAQKALDAFRKEMEIRGAIGATKRDLQQYDGLRLITPAQVDRQVITASGVPDDEFDRLMDHYRQANKLAPVGSFYAALSDHWNDAISYAEGVGGYVEQGAIGAATGILGQSDMLDERLDVAKLVRGLGVEGAAYALATDIIREHRHDPKQIDRVIQALTDFNATNQGATEERALRRHDELKRNQELIEGMLRRNELVGGDPSRLTGTGTKALQAIGARASAEGMRLLTENLVAQRANLGTALGSMQMAATLVHALESTKSMVSKGDAGAQFVTLYYGDNEDFRNEAANSLTVGQGGLVPGRDPNLGYSLHVDTMRLGRYVGRIKAETQRNNEWQAQKESDKGVKEIGGQEVVPDYRVPFFKDTYTDADGEEKPLYMRRNQRNDIEWLRKSGGGVITRTTGAGKTNTVLGFYAHQIADKPDYHGVAVVPNRRGEQWLSEANNFTTLNAVHVPDDAKPAEVEAHLKNFAHMDNGVLIIGHRQAARNAHWLQALRDGGKLHGMAIDEPQEMQGKSASSRLTSGAQEVMKVGNTVTRGVSATGNPTSRSVPDPSFHRIALTATPAKAKPVQCLPASTLVTFADGRRLPIGQVCAERISGDVLSVDVGTGEIEPRPITDWHITPQGARALYHVQLTSGIIFTATEDHRVWTQRGWVRVDELLVTDSCAVPRGDGAGDVAGGRLAGVRKELGDPGTTRSEAEGLLLAQVRSLTGLVQVAAGRVQGRVGRVREAPRARVHRAAPDLLPRRATGGHAGMGEPSDGRELGLLVHGRRSPQSARYGDVGLRGFFGRRGGAAGGGARPAGVCGASASIWQGAQHLLGPVVDPAILSSDRPLGRFVPTLQGVPAGGAGVHHVRHILSAQEGRQARTPDLFRNVQEGAHLGVEPRVLPGQPRPVRGLEARIAFAPVGRITVALDEGTVYCLSVGGNNNFFADGVLVHNCYDLVNWTNPGALGPRTKFDQAFSSFAEGTSAADDALANMIGKEIGPYVSGDEEVNHPFDLKVNEHLVLRTPQQVQRQMAIEGSARAEMKRLSDARFTSMMNRVAQTRPESEIRAEANQWARQQIQQRHRDNLDSGDTNDSGTLLDPSAAAKANGKIRALMSEIKRARPGEKHVIFTDGKAQRAAVTQAIRDAGYKPDAVKNITGEASPKDVEARKRAWKHGGANVPFLIIDKSSASGHNLQEGDHLHVLAAPEDAATLLQAQGRVARGNKRTDTTIHTYRTHDSPFETRDWEQIDRGMKLMAATSPGLAKKFLERVTKARAAALKAADRPARSAPADDGEQMVAKSRRILFLR